jgi:hypothetical protein
MCIGCVTSLQVTPSGGEILCSLHWFRTCCNHQRRCDWRCKGAFPTSRTPPTPTLPYCQSRAQWGPTSMARSLFRGMRGQDGSTKKWVTSVKIELKLSVTVGNTSIKAAIRRPCTDDCARHLRESEIECGVSADVCVNMTHTRACALARVLCPLSYCFSLLFISLLFSHRLPCVCTAHTRQQRNSGPQPRP